MGLSVNTYYSGGYKYVSTAAATQYRQAAGVHYWFNAPSGTAGNAITFTQAMTLDASGNLLVGATSPLVNAGGRGNITVNGSTDAVLSFGIGGSTAGYLYQGPSTLILNTQGARAITFENNGTERARIDSSGNLLVGTTATNASLTQGVTAVIGSGASKIHIGHATGSVDGSTYAVFSYNGTAIGTITQSLTSAVLYNTTSDYRLKTVIGAVSGSGERIDALEPIEYEWKVDGSRTRGFLAHKFQEVYAGSVSGDKDAVDAEGNPVYQAMQAGSAEVIADLVAEIKSLRQRVAQLESN